MHSKYYESKKTKTTYILKRREYMLKVPTKWNMLNAQLVPWARMSNPNGNQPRSNHANAVSCWCLD